MIFSSIQIYDLLILILGIVGFKVSFHIHNKKQEKKKLICPMKASCDTVLHSSHSNFLGIPLERLGVVYYSIVIIVHGLSFILPGFGGEIFPFISIISATLAALFSFYLLSVQAFVLRRWCSWCLISTGASIAIFLGTFFLPIYDLKTIFADLRHIITIFHLFGVVLGLGAATISDILFFKFLKDYKISGDEDETLTTLSQVIWFALGILIITGLALYIPGADRLAESGKFLAKMSVLGVLVINGFLLNILIAPTLTRMSFVEDEPHEKDEFRKLRKLSFALGAVSMTSWYFVFVLGALRGITFPFSKLILIYVVLLVGAVVGSQFFGKMMTKKKSDLPQDLS